MAKVFVFPQKKQLPKCVEEDLRRISKEYIETLYVAATLMDLEADKPTYEEVLELVSTAFAEGISEAIEELEED